MTPRRIVFFGELLLRFDPEGFDRLVQAGRLRVRYTGAEANVGVALCGWGWRAAMVSRVPRHELGQAAVNFLRARGLDTAAVQRGDGRLGLLFVETGCGPRASRVVYDRAHPAYADFDGSAVDWDEVLRDAGWFHFSGTAVAAAPRLAPILAAGCAAARRHRLTVSCDVNFRRTVWSRVEAAPTLERLAAGAGLLICSGEEAAELFGIAADGTGADEAVARALAERFGAGHVAVTRRESLSASRARWSATLRDGRGETWRETHAITAVDRIGAGDAFAAGLIHGLAAGWPGARTLAFAAASCRLKHTIPGDFNLVSAEEVEALAGGDAAGRLRR